MLYDELVKQEQKKAFFPPSELSISEWIEENIVLSPVTTGNPGPYSFQHHNYLIGICDSIEEPTVQTVSILKCTQSGLSQLVCNIIMWYVCIKTLPITYFTATQTMYKNFVNEKFHPTLEHCSEIQKFRSEDIDDETFSSFNFPNRSIVRMGTGGSIASTAGSPAALVICDEVSKWKNSKTEANSIDLALQRTRSFPLQKKHILISTPAEESSCRIYAEYLKGDMRVYKVKSPNTGELFEMTIECLTKPKDCILPNGEYDWHKIKTETVLSDPTTREYDLDGNISFIGLPITKFQRDELVNDGVWVPTNPNPSDPTHHSFSVNSFFTNDVSWGELLVMYMQSQDDIEARKTLQTQYFGRPWAQRTISTHVGYIDNIIRKSKEAGIDYCKGEVPRKCEYLIGGVDSQKDRYPWVIEALCNDGTSYVVDYGEALDFDALKEIGNREYPLQGDASTRYPIDRFLIDEGGFEKGPVRDFSITTNFQFTCCKGNSKTKSAKQSPDNDGESESEIKMTTLYSKKLMDHTGGRIPYYFVNDREYKNRLVGTYFQQGKSKLFFPKDCSDEFKRQITNESLDSVKTKRGSIKYEWRSHGANHFLDCIKYIEALKDDYLMHIPVDSTDNNHE